MLEVDSKRMKISKSENRKYWAFISYSSKDEEQAKWLRKRLENYRIPRDLRGIELFKGARLGKHLRPIFRDRDELSGSSNLGPAIQEALRQSYYLIALCSKHSAQSEWVNKEIEVFRAMGGEKRILALILDGVPNATSSELTADSYECFPPALRYPLEPLAGDLRLAIKLEHVPFLEFLQRALVQRVAFVKHGGLC